MNNIEKIKGIGPKTLENLAKLNIYTLTDLQHYFPFRYNIIKKTSLTDEKAVVSAIIETEPRVMYFNNRKNKLSFRAVVENKYINISIFNRAYLKDHLIAGKEITLIGKYDSVSNNFTASDISFIKLTNKPIIEPIYHITANFKMSNLRKIIAESLNYDTIQTIPEYLEEKYNFVKKSEALLKIHFPASEIEIEEAKKRFVYEELFEFMFKINYIKLSKKKSYGIERKINYEKVEDFISKLPFKLTLDQEKSILEIYNDLISEYSMNRLLQGDVGSGKTIVALISIYMNYLSGHMSALMAPTEVLAQQHFNNFKQILGDKIHLELLTGKLKKKEKDTIKEKIKNGEVDILIGTHSLITEDVDYHKLGLVITDEQHRFGVNQRNAFKNKGNNPDILYMSATPIPRTYALTLYGDMEISNIKTMPSGRKEIITKVYKESDIKEVLTMMLNELKKKHQIYVIAPLIDSNEELEMQSVDEVYEKINKAFGKYFKIDKLHGKMKPKEKEEAMNKFALGETNILVSTTVVEVGVDVKNATMIVIYDSMLFGLSTLHQLRGRVGRNQEQSYCILISEKETKRLEILSQTNDGFLISEEDFKLRGSGDLFGTEQSGDMKFKVADIKKNYDILVKAKDDSLEYLLKDNYLEYYKEIIKKLNNIS